MARDSKMPLKIFLTAGEASGDTLGAALMQALKDQARQPLSFHGVGGPQMEKEGMTSLFPMNDLSVMGLTEVLPRLRKILKRIAQTSDAIREISPDICVTIDSPDFSFRVAERVHRKGGKGALPFMLHYVAPTVWAWRPERAKKVAKLYDGVICLYPMEPLYFEKEGMKALFAGHPVLAQSYDQADGSALRAELGIPDDAIVLGLMFGSRMRELNITGPVLREAARKIVRGRNDIHILSLGLPHLQRTTENLLQRMGCKTHLVTDQNRKAEAFAAMNIAIATSGTVGLELSAAGVPHLIAYSMGHITWQILKRKLTTRFAHLSNILLDKEAVPEFIQNNCKIEKIADTLGKLLNSKEIQDQQRSAFIEVRRKLAGENPDVSPAKQAARFVLEMAKNSNKTA